MRRTLIALTLLAAAGALAAGCGGSKSGTGGYGSGGASSATTAAPSGASSGGGRAYSGGQSSSGAGTTAMGEDREGEAELVAVEKPFVVPRSPRQRSRGRDPEASPAGGWPQGAVARAVSGCGRSRSTRQPRRRRGARSAAGCGAVARPATTPGPAGPQSTPDRRTPISRSSPPLQPGQPGFWSVSYLDPGGSFNARDPEACHEGSPPPEAPRSNTAATGPLTSGGSLGSNTVTRC